MYAFLEKPTPVQGEIIIEDEQSEDDDECEPEEENKIKKLKVSENIHRENLCITLEIEITG